MKPILSANRILRDSHTFNYLESQRYFLGLGDEVEKLDTFYFGTDTKVAESERAYATEYDSPSDLPTSEFYSKCVRLNKACVMRGLAKEWPAMKNWNADNNG